MTVKDLLQCFTTQIGLIQIKTNNEVKELNSLEDVYNSYGDRLVSRWNVYNALTTHVAIHFDNSTLYLKNLNYL